MYLCLCCGDQFTRLTYLKCHIDSVHFGCNFCDELEYTQKELDEHIRCEHPYVSISVLPTEIILKIIKKLPVKDLIQFSLVSKHCSELAIDTLR